MRVVSHPLYDESTGWEVVYNTGWWETINHHQRKNRATGELCMLLYPALLAPQDLSWRKPVEDSAGMVGVGMFVFRYCMLVFNVCIDKRVRVEWATDTAPGYAWGLMEEANAVQCPIKLFRQSFDYNSATKTSRHVKYTWAEIGGYRRWDTQRFPSRLQVPRRLATWGRISAPRWRIRVCFSVEPYCRGFVDIWHDWHVFVSVSINDSYVLLNNCPAHLDAAGIHRFSEYEINFSQSHN